MTMKPQQSDSRQTCERCGWTSDDPGTFAAAELCHVCVSAPPRPTASAGTSGDGSYSFGLALGEAAQHTRYAVEDIEGAFEAMPADIGISVGLDLTAAKSHLITARRLLAHAADAQEVTR